MFRRSYFQIYIYSYKNKVFSCPSTLAMANKKNKRKAAEASPPSVVEPVLSKTSRAKPTPAYTGATQERPWKSVRLILPDEESTDSDEVEDEDEECDKDGEDEMITEDYDEGPSIASIEYVPQPVKKVKATPKAGKSPFFVFIYSH
jgi:hypothetical protein